MLRLAIAATIIWFLVVLACGFNAFRSSPTFELNALGDWFAGALSPVALAWFVAAFLLQRKDLQKNSEAVELQRSEIKAATEIAREQLTAQIAKDRPLLRIDSATIRLDDEDGEPRLVLKAHNIGGKNATGIRATGYEGEFPTYEAQLWFQIPSASDGYIWLRIPLSRRNQSTNYSIEYCATADLRTERNHRGSTGDSYALYLKVVESETGAVRLESGTFSAKQELPRFT